MSSKSPFSESRKVQTVKALRDTKSTRLAGRADRHGTTLDTIPTRTAGFPMEGRLRQLQQENAQLRRMLFACIRELAAMKARTSKDP